MLEYEGALLIAVALVTDCVATGQCPDLAQRDRSMCVVTIAALNQALVDPVTIGPREVSFRGSVTSVTEIGLGSNQQMLRGFGMMRRVTIQTAHIVAGMRGTGEVPLLVTITMTGQTPGARFLSRQPFKGDDLTDVTTTGYVFGSRAVTRFTAVSALQCSLEVGGTFKIVFV
jgi:hypothetical protein